MFLIKTTYEDGNVEFSLYENLTDLDYEHLRLKNLGVKFNYEIITN